MPPDVKEKAIQDENVRTIVIRYYCEIKNQNFGLMNGEFD